MQRMTRGSVIFTVMARTPTLAGAYRFGNVAAISLAMSVYPAVRGWIF